jgi:AAA family ATP:ADP antiporter
MKDRLILLKGIEPAKKSTIFFLLLQSIFLGIFYGTFDITAHSLFLSIYDEKSLAIAYALSGLAGIVLTYVYKFLKLRIRVKSFITGNFIFISLVTLALWILLMRIPVKTAVYFMLVLFGPLNILAMLGFQSVTGILFNKNGRKKIDESNESGVIAGIMLGCFIIPILLLLKLQVNNMLIISIVSIIVVVVAQIALSKESINAATDIVSGRSNPVISMLKENSFKRIALIFVALSVFALFFIQYSFLAATRLQYPQVYDMAMFLALFAGIMMLFAFLSRLFVFPILARNYGLKFNLVVVPVILAFFTILTIVIGAITGFSDYGSNGFIMFLILLALNRFISRASGESVGSGSIKVIFQPLDQGVWRILGETIKGPFNEIIVLLSCLVLAGLGSFSFMKIIGFSWALLIIIIVWIYISFRLYSEFRRYLLETHKTDVPEQTAGQVEEISGGLSGRAAGMTLFRLNYYKLLTGDMSVLEKTSNRWLIEQVIYHTEIHQDPCMKSALKEISTGKIFDETMRHRAARILAQLEETGGDPWKLQDKTMSSKDRQEIIDARKILSGQTLPQTTQILRLLRDKDIESKRFAIYMIGKFHLADMIKEVCDCLGVVELGIDIDVVLKSFGQEATNHLVNAFLRFSGNINISRSLIRLIGSSCSGGSKDFLFTRIWSSSRLIREMATAELIQCRYIAKKQDQPRLYDLISEIVDIVNWNNRVQAVISEAGNTVLDGSICKDNDRWILFLFNLLSITCGYTIVEKIKENIENSSSSAISYAYEIIDIITDETIKYKLINLIDIIACKEKIKNTKKYLQVAMDEYYQIAEDILNRDYNCTSIWVKASTLRTMGELPGNDLRESVNAMLFSPEKILWEEASLLINRVDKTIFRPVLQRIEKERRQLIERIIAGQIIQKELIYEKLLFLSSVFAGIPEDMLLQLTDSLVYSEVFPSIESGEQNMFLLWAFDTGRKRVTPFLLQADNVNLVRKYCIGSQIKDYYMLPLDNIEETGSRLPVLLSDTYSYIDSIEIVQDDLLRDQTGH